MIFLIFFVVILLILAILGIVSKAVKSSAVFMDDSLRWGGGRNE